MQSSVYDRIGDFYNATTDAWVLVWGDHCHHGYFESYSSTKTPYEAQIALIEKLLAFGDVPARYLSKNKPIKDMRILDVGCGVGGSSRYLSKKFPTSNVTGVNISDRQISIANELTKENKEIDSNRVEFIKMNAMDLKFEENTFDLIWSCEMAEHIPNHLLFLKNCYNVLKPDGTLLIATWCCKDEKKLNIIDKFILKIVDKYFNDSLNWISVQTYSKHLETNDKLSFTNVQYDEWTKNVSIFWVYVLKSIFTKKGLYSMFCQGNSYLWYSIISVLFMWVGLAFGTIKFAVMSARKSRV